MLPTAALRSCSLPRGSVGGCRRRWAAALVACCVLAATPAAASAGDVYVALGDSYTAGPLIPNQHGDPIGCGRSDHNYPSLVAAAIKASAFVDESCSGAVTANMTGPQKPSLLGPEAGLLGTHRPQFDFLRRDATLVTIGIGSNDAGLVGVGYACAARGLLQPTGTPCKDSYATGGSDRVGQAIEQAAPKVAAVFRGIRERAPNARVLAVGYPAVVPEDGRTCWPVLPFADGDVPWFARLLKRINAMIATQAAANDVEFVDVYPHTLGYDVCQPVGRAGYTFIVPTNGLSLMAHPNATGMRLAADAVSAVLATPRPQPAPRAATLRIRKVVARRRSLAISGTVDPVYQGRVRITIVGRAGSRTLRLRKSSAPVTGGRWRVVLARPRSARGRLKAVTITASTPARDGLTADRARRMVRR